MMKLPYGIADFRTIRTEGYVYVDKTRYLRLLEERAERRIILLRSRRFGKSLFCNMLGWYDDRNHAAPFEVVSGIPKTPFPKQPNPSLSGGRGWDFRGDA